MIDRGYRREPLLTWFQEPPGVRDVYGGLEGLVTLTAHHLVPDAAIAGDTLLLFMHPMGVMSYLPLPMALAAAGVPVLLANSRYPNNDHALIMEKVVVDLGHWIAHARQKLGYARIVLAGWSGGGSLSLFYQAQAERPSLTHTPAGDPCDLVAAGLIPADAVMLLAAHVSRAHTLTEWLDPSIVDETDPDVRDPAWNLYAEAPPMQPPYPVDWVAAFRARQIARNRAITAWAQDQLVRLKAAHGPHAERSFIIHGTMADPRWLDPSLDPNERAPGRCYLGDPRLINDAPGGLGRVATLRSWLSQWSCDLSNADGVACARQVSVPALVIGNGADDACTPSHTTRLFEALAPADKQMHTIAGANHYYARQPAQAAEAAGIILNWLSTRGWRS
jgi:pimeloyl-ACP methyl ester carboxylesterase